MPFAMTHLIIAKNIQEKSSNLITDMPQFYLGVIAPDAVHNRANYISDYKKVSHLCVGTEKWGQITNNDEWQKNVVSFFEKHRNTENRDFILGYCIHILADIYNNINSWTPYRLKYPDELKKGYSNRHHIESNKVDIELAFLYKNTSDFWSNISISTGVDLPNVICAGEIERQKDYILNLFYKDKERQDLTSNEFVTIETTRDFVENATAYIIDIL